MDESSLRYYTELRPSSLRGQISVESARLGYMLEQYFLRREELSRKALQNRVADYVFRHWARSAAVPLIRDVIAKNEAMGFLYANDT
jgi:hypothetical protein